MSEEPQGPELGARRKKIVILGGGLGALTTAYELTSQPDWEKEYEVTVYQLGWRLGGKGASGRNRAPAYHDRIQEHGIHVFFGFYDNAFRLMQSCYGELNRPPQAPLATWQQAFKPHSFIVVPQQVLGEWYPWAWNAPTNGEIPGQGGVPEHLADYAWEALELVWEVFGPSRLALRPLRPTEQARFPDPPHDELEGLFGDLIHDLPIEDRQVEWSKFEPLNARARLFRAAVHIARRLRKHDPEAARAAVKRNLHELPPDLAREVGETVDLPAGDIIGIVLSLIVLFLKAVLDWAEPILGFATLMARIFGFCKWLCPPVYRALVERYRDVLLTWICLNFVYANLKGILADKLYQVGIQAINDQDYAGWVGKHAVPDGGITAGSALVRWLYAAVFAFEQGDLTRPNLEAGTALLAMTRVTLTYKGALTWKMQAGMGDVIFAPLYEVLAKRGVHFEFFHRVLNLAVSADGSRIERIAVNRQADVVGGAEYQPLFDVKGLPCWPSEPFYHQLVQGEEIERLGIDLESYSDAWPGVETFDLLAGRDFDAVVLGISRAALPCVASEVIAASPAWQAMTGAVQTVRTQAFQLWLKEPLHKLGWPLPPPILAGYEVSPLNCWVDMAQLLERESWPPEGPASPRDIAYFCGIMRETAEPPCDPSPRLPEVKEEAARLLTQDVGLLWPKATAPPPFDWSLLVDDRPDPGKGEERLDAQYFASLHNPSDRYVLSVVDSSRYRLYAGGTGFENLFVTGDWIQNTFNVGCAEATVMAGMATSNAISGFPALSDIVGWGLFQKP